MNLGNARRVLGDLKDDEELLTLADAQLQATFEHYSDAYGQDHPCSHGCALNLAVVRGRLGRSDEARHLLEDAVAGFRRRLGDDHHYTLSAMTALASALAEIGDVDQAVSLGERALQGLREVLHEDHPHTLACQVNLAIDLAELGQQERSDELAADAVARYEERLPPDHFDVADARRRRRIVVDFEAPLL
jgi:tetratricopeptide (TPR) repeat protein